MLSPITQFVQFCHCKSGKEKTSSTSEVEEWLILVQRPSYFSTSHLLIFIQTRISISQLWTIVSQVVDYCKPVMDYCKPGLTILSQLDYYNASGLFYHSLTKFMLMAYANTAVLKYSILFYCTTFVVSEISKLLH